MKALLLSAGLGTRLRPYTLQLPKPCIPFFGVPLSWYSLFLLDQVGCHDITVNLHHLPEKIQKLCRRPEVKKFKFQFSLEKEKPMGSGGALYYAKDKLAGSKSFFAINSDEVFIPSRRDILNNLVAHHQKTQSLATLLVTDHPDLRKTLKPIWIDKDGNIKGFGMSPPEGQVRPVHYTGCKIFSEDVLQLIPPGETHIFLETLVPAIAKGAVVNTVFDPCQWWETGDFQSFLKASGDVIEIMHRSPDKNYFKDVYAFLNKPYNLLTDVSGNRKVARDAAVILDREATDGIVFVDSDVRVSAKTQLKNALVNSGMSVEGPLADTMIFREDP